MTQPKLHNHFKNKFAGEHSLVGEFKYSDWDSEDGITDYVDYVTDDRRMIRVHFSSMTAVITVEYWESLSVDPIMKKEYSVV